MRAMIKETNDSCHLFDVQLYNAYIYSLTTHSCAEKNILTNRCIQKYSSSETFIVSVHIEAFNNTLVSEAGNYG